MNKYIEDFMRENNLKVGDRFKIENYECDFWFNSKGVLQSGISPVNYFEAALLLYGELQITRPPKKAWKPAKNELYYYVACSGVIGSSRNEEEDLEEYLFAHNLVFSTVSEAEDYKWFLIKIDEYKKPFKVSKENAYLYYDHCSEKIDIAVDREYQTGHVIYFGETENLTVFKDTVGDERIKKYIFGIYD